ncbi:MAG TPA: C-type lectin domain-containing protein [Kofleriaceae bacterium]|nr:C-type lectin domain-containing protein [Kofleriaceae bacterium]
MRLGCLCIALVAACGFEHGTSVTRDDAPSTLDDVLAAVDAPGDTMNVIVDAPPDSSLPPPPCSTTGLICVGTTVAMNCNGACWVGCTQTANVPNQDHAVTACTAWGGKLAPIRTQADQNCVEQIFQGELNWIGFEQSSTATSLTTGWTWNSDGLTPTYTHWAAGQPNDVNGNENDHAEQCAFMDDNGTWGDSQCGNAAYFRFSCRK